MNPQALDLTNKLTQFHEYWAPRTITEFNGHDVMVVKICGDFTWHSHADTDDFFFVLQGTMFIDLPDDVVVQINPGQIFVVPRGVPHRPRAPEEVHLLLIEPSGTPNSGDIATAAPRRWL
ncbi:cupin domain-containing protein [Dyella silvatica]|uniref:cupin domain-containing protein n=1 Tax=Dyella silvatica TaxID=2992128 RepID=UPI00225BBC92|nr:cupin domain-containing protein [Dyella silvatica]